MLKTVSRRVNGWVERILFCLGISMALIVAVQVFFRYVLNQSLFWSEELARYLLVWLTFLGASVAYFRGAHPGVDVLHRRMPPAVRKAAAILAHLAGLALFCIMVVYGARFAYFVRLQVSPALGIPKWMVLTIIPLSGSILIVHGINFLAEAIRGGRYDR